MECCIIWWVIVFFMYVYFFASWKFYVCVIGKDAAFLSNWLHINVHEVHSLIVKNEMISSELRRTVDISIRRGLRSAASCQRDVLLTCLKAVSNWAFSVAGPRLWNRLPDDIVSCQLLPSFCFWRKHLCKQSYPDVILIYFCIPFTAIVALRFSLKPL